MKHSEFDAMTPWARWKLILALTNWLDEKTRNERLAAALGDIADVDRAIIKQDAARAVDKTRNLGSAGVLEAYAAVGCVLMQHPEWFVEEAEQ